MKMPKIHALEDHLIATMEQWNGIGDFLEDFIEQANQLRWRKRNGQPTWEIGWQQQILIQSGSGPTRWAVMCE
jgi:hypothetical protein